MRGPLSVSLPFPPFLLLKILILAFLQKSYLLFLRSKNYETNFVVFHEMASFQKKYKINHVFWENIY